MNGQSAPTKEQSQFPLEKNNLNKYFIFKMEDILKAKVVLAINFIFHPSQGRYEKNKMASKFNGYGKRVYGERG